jgi:hypothetical protein
LPSAETPVLTVFVGKHLFSGRLNIRRLRHMSLFKVGVSRLSKPLSAEHLGDEAETQKVMSQKCIENMYFSTIFLRHKKR